MVSLWLRWLSEAVQLLVAAKTHVPLLHLWGSFPVLLIAMGQRCHTWVGLLLMAFLPWWLANPQGGGFLDSTAQVHLVLCLKCVMSSAIGSCLQLLEVNNHWQWYLCIVWESLGLSLSSN